MKRLALSALLCLSACPGAKGSSSDGGSTGDDERTCGEAGNLLDNPNFECGDTPTGWTAMGGEALRVDTDPKEGTHAVRLTASTSGAVSLWHEGDVLSRAEKGTYCATAWMRGSAQDGRLTVRLADGKGGGRDENFSSPLATPTWTLVPPPTFGALKFDTAGEEQVLLRVWIPNAQAGDVLEVDGVRFWKSADGTCREP